MRLDISHRLRILFWPFAAVYFELLVEFILSCWSVAIAVEPDGGNGLKRGPEDDGDWIASVGIMD